MERENEEKPQKDIVAYIDTPKGLFIRSDSIIKLIDDAIASGISQEISEESVTAMQAVKELFLRDFDRINIQKMVG